MKNLQVFKSTMNSRKCEKIRKFLYNILPHDFKIKYVYDVKTCEKNFFNF